MTIPFTCPHCGQHTDVDERHAGCSGPCVSCGNTITIPLLGNSIASGPTAAAKSGRRGWWIAGILLGGVASVAVAVVILVSMLRPAYLAAREAARCAACEANLRRISTALEDYYVDQGHYPPAVVYDAQGVPLHSWRVLLLPYLGPECEQLHAQYDRTTPWDSPHNARLIPQIPAVYQCPSDARAALGETSYLAVVGINTVISNRPEQPTTQQMVTDPWSQTSVVFETKASAVNWLEPKDIGLDQLRAGLNSRNIAAPGSNHIRGVNTLMLDGSVARLPDLTPSADLRAMSTIDGDEFIETLDDLDY